MSSKKVKELANGIKNKDVRSLSKAITLVESTRKEDLKEAADLVSLLMPISGKSIRMGVSGLPGVGKSSLINNFGEFLLARDKKVAVLSIDPSSDLSGGSLLGDKTRMNSLSSKTYVRPSPNSGNLGGANISTPSVITLLEAFGYDFVIVETVGVGQSEYEIAKLVDCFMLMLLPGAGDEVQAIKKGALEHADIITIHKSDGDFLSAAKKSVNSLKFASGLKISNDFGKIFAISSLYPKEAPNSYEDLYKEIINSTDKLKQSGEFQTRRELAKISWFKAQFINQIKNWIEASFSKEKNIDPDILKSIYENPLKASFDLFDEIIRKDL